MPGVADIFRESEEQPEDNSHGNLLALLGLRGEKRYATGIQGIWFLMFIQTYVNKLTAQLRDSFIKHNIAMAKK